MHRILATLLIIASFSTVADSLDSWTDSRGHRHHESKTRVPADVFDDCLARYGESEAARSCMNRNRGYRQEAKRIVEQNPGVGAKQVYQSCLAKYGADDMDTVRHCVQAELNYRRIFGR